MNTSLRRVFSILAATLLAAGLFAGCQSGAPATSSAPVQTSASAQQTEAPTPEPVEKITLTKLTASNPDLDTLTGGDYNKTPSAIELEKRTGVHIEHIMTTGQDYDTRMNLLIASGEMPDLFSLPGNYPGSYTKAAEDGVIVKINDYWDKLAPNLKRVAESKPEWLKSLKADNGDVYAFPVFREDKSITVFFGPLIRKDLLDAAGLAVPETIDEWHTALTAFKNAGVKNPFTSMNWFITYSGAFVGAFGATDAGDPGSIVPGQDGKMHYGPTQAGYKQYLETFHQWYQEGLIDPDFPTLTDWGVLATKVTSGEAGSALFFLSGANEWTAAGQQTNPAFELVGAKYPVVNKGDQPLYGQCDPPLKLLYSISAKSQHIERAISYLDYGYSEEGQMFFNFGIQDESYTLDAEGNPVYTELITATPKNSKGWTQAQALLMYCPAASDYATIQRKSYFEQIRLTTDRAKNCVALWSESTLPSIPPNLSLTKAETMVTKKRVDIDTYVQEMAARFIMGTEPLSNWDQYVERCKQLGVEDVVEVYNDALTRFNNR